MTEKLKQKMSEELAKLPREKQEAINSIEWGEITAEVGAKFLLNDSEVNDLQVITGLVLIGLIDLDAYTRNIEKEVGTSAEDAKKITNEVFTKVFSPIIDKLEAKAMHKVPSWGQTVNFILSGGDYSSFINEK